MTIHIHFSFCRQTQFLGITQHIIVIQQERPATQIGNTGIVVVFVRKRYGLAFQAAECQVTITGNFCAEIGGILTFTIGTQHQRIAVSSLQIKLRQAIADIQAVIIYSTRQTIVISANGSFFPILLNITLRTAGESLSIFILQLQIARIPQHLRTLRINQQNGAVIIINFSER